MPTLYPTPLVTQPVGVDLSGSSTVPLVPLVYGVVGEVNTYVFTADVSGAIVVYTEIDTIEWDSSDNIVYKRVVIDGEPGPFGNEIDVQVTLINNVEYDLPEDDTVVGEINALVNQIKCSRVQGMGTLSDYTALLDLAQDISGSVNLALDISGLTAIANKAQEYGAIFEEITQTLSDVTVINNVAVLESIRDELQKIASMYDNLKALKLTIQRTSTLQIPDSIQSTAVKLNQVYDELACSLDYLDYFCDGTAASEEISTNGALNAQDQSVIDAATGALNLFSTLVANQGVVNAGTNTQVKNLSTAVSKFAQLQARMQGAVDCLNNQFNAL